MKRSSLFKETSFLKPRGTGWEVHLLRLANNSHHTNHKQRYNYGKRLYYQPPLLNIQKLLSRKEFPRLHQLSAALLTSDILPLPIVRRLTYFLNNWWKLTNSLMVFNMVKHLSILFNLLLEQSVSPSSHLFQVERGLVDKINQDMLIKEIILIEKPAQEQFLENIRGRTTNW